VSQLSEIEHVVVLMLENRSFDHMLGFFYADSGNRSPSGQPGDVPSHIEKIHAEQVALLRQRPSMSRRG
jgi:phospholipase C